nr:uncharacterized protein LOC124210864 [Neodiprion pinetum]
MGSNWKLLPLLIIVLATCIHEGLGIKCWVCRSDYDPKCADPFDNTTVPITDCNREQPLEHLPGVTPTMCEKSRQKVNGKWIYFRRCARMRVPDIAGDARSCVMSTSNDNIPMEYCTCDNKDGCNTGPLVHSNQFVVPLAALVTYFVTCFYIK